LQHTETSPVKIFGTDMSLGPVTITCERVCLTPDEIEALRIGIQSLTGEATLQIRFMIVEECPIQAWYPKWLPTD